MKYDGCRSCRHRKSGDRKVEEFHLLLHLGNSLLEITREGSTKEQWWPCIIYERTQDVIRLVDILKVVLSRHVDENEWRFSPVSLSLPREWDFSIFQRLRIPRCCQFRNFSCDK